MLPEDTNPRDILREASDLAAQLHAGITDEELLAITDQITSESPHYPIKATMPMEDLIAYAEEIYAREQGKDPAPPFRDAQRGAEHMRRRLHSIEQHLRMLIDKADDCDEQQYQHITHSIRQHQHERQLAMEHLEYYTQLLDSKN